MVVEEEEVVVAVVVVVVVVEEEEEEEVVVVVVVATYRFKCRTRTFGRRANDSRFVAAPCVLHLAQ